MTGMHQTELHNAGKIPHYLPEVAVRTAVDNLADTFD